MAKSLIGNAGLLFNVTETNTTTATGSSIVQSSIESSVGDLVITNTDYSIGLSGTIGTTTQTLDLNSIQNISGGVDAMNAISVTTPIALTSLKCMHVHNKSVGTITLTPNVTDSFLTIGEQITIPSGCAVGLSYGTAQTVSATVKNIDITGSANGLACEIYILGA